LVLFVDILTSQLEAMAVAFLVLAYGLVKTYRVHSTVSDYRNALQSIYVPALLLGAFITLTGIYGLIVWPLISSYNILFYDLYPILGIGIIGIAISVKYNYKLEVLGFMALLYGLVTIYYGVVGFQHSMTSEPIALLALYGLTGLSSVFFYPVSLFIDYGKYGKIFLILDAILLILAGLLAGYIGLEAVPEHLVSFSKWVPPTL
jgi:putative membrane protein